MAGVKGKSGPPGNLHGARHFWRSFWKRRALRPVDQWVATELDRYSAGLLSDRPDPSEGERRAIELAAEAKACRLLIWRAIQQAGFTQTGERGLCLIPAAEALPKFIGAELGALKLLGLERRAKPVQSLDDYLSVTPGVEETSEEEA